MSIDLRRELDTGGAAAAVLAAEAMYAHEHQLPWIAAAPEIRDRYLTLAVIAVREAQQVLALQNAAVHLQRMEYEFSRLRGSYGGANTGAVTSQLEDDLRRAGDLASTFLERATARADATIGDGPGCPPVDGVPTKG
ncbi:hypothetical protein V6N00_13050 [Tersicoccus sp. MR15.9]|uniref:hypothetical protein n=1 Tax=Tersicoccus mangrovi TaxID=3121635 RepID=UPI002FE5582E